MQIYRQGRNYSKLFNNYFEIIEIVQIFVVNVRNFQKTV